MWSQKEIVLRPRESGIHPVTDEILKELLPLPDIGLLNLFIKQKEEQERLVREGIEAERTKIWNYLDKFCNMTCRSQVRKKR